VERFTQFAAKLTVPDVSFIPVSALDGDNVVLPSVRMPWYHGGPLLHRLETMRAGSRRNLIDARFAVQQVIRVPGFRGYAGTVASGSFAADAEVVVLPSGATTRIQSIETADGPLPRAAAGAAVVLTLADAVDVSRGDLIVPVRNLPTLTSRLDAYLCCLASEALVPNRPYLLRHLTREVTARIDLIEYRVNVDTLHREPADTLPLNEIGRARLAVSSTLSVDPYRLNSATGSFILIDPHTHATIAAGLIRGAAASPPIMVGTTPGVGQGQAVSGAVTRVEREAHQGHRAGVVWLTGLSGAGKTTIARLIERRLFGRGCHVIVLDGDRLRRGLSRDLGFSPEDRAENIRRAAEVAALAFEQGAIVLCAFISPYRRDRAAARALVPEGRFLEVFVRADLDTCRARDPKQLYTGADAGTISQFTGVSAPYEEPLTPDLVLDTTVASPEATAEILEDVILRLVREQQPDAGDERGTG
jgi:bifunctional enzyme CysN/CysC